MLNILVNGAPLKTTTTPVSVIVHLSLAAASIVVPHHHRVTHTIKLDYGVQLCHQLVCKFNLVRTLKNMSKVQNVLCLFSTECSNGAVRLVGGQSTNEGRVEYCYNGGWTQFCEGNFRIEEAIVACRQLGYTNPSKNVQLS